MTEAEARAVLRAFVAVGELERWIADQRWERIPNGWRASSYQVARELRGFHAARGFG